MAKIKILFILALFSGILFSSCSRHTVAQKTDKRYYYTCPMHSEVIEMKPGKCPKCGMTLEEWDFDNMPKRSSGGSHSSHGSSGGGSGGCH